MKDLVLKGFVKSFAESHGLAGEDASEVFEAFAASVVLRKFHACDVPDLTDVLTSGTSDGGIDAVAILVNGRPIQTTEDLAFFSSRLRRFSFEFVFVQAKTSPEFHAGGIGTFMYGISQFFSESPKIRFNGDIESLRTLKNEVYDLSIAMDQNPSCHAYYVTTGTWNADAEPQARMESGRRALVDTHLFSQVEGKAIDAGTLKSVFRELERGVTREVVFNKTAVFPVIDGVSEAYLGLLPATEYLTLISHADGHLNRELFYDNVRDYQGNNPVNRDIAATLDGKTTSRFPLLNNGITIVARNINRTGDQFRISDFQIVNGCQTTHVLHQHKASITEETYIPVKLVVTDDSEIITEVIKATNWQTAVMPEALESLTPFHKEIEDFYNSQEASQPKQSRIYYERRSKQYHFDPIPQSRIVTLTAQTKSFVGMLLNEPHSHPRYYGELLKAYESRLFVSDHKPALYFASGLAFLAVHEMFSRGALPRHMRPYAYHLLMLLRIKLMGERVPRFNSNDATNYSLRLIEKLRDEPLSLAQCEESVGDIERRLKTFHAESQRNPPHRKKAFTEALLATVEGVSAVEVDPGISSPIGGPQQGSLRWFDDVKGYGFIACDAGDDVFVHATELSEVPWIRRVESTRLEFHVRQTHKGFQARDVRMLGE